MLPNTPLWNSCATDLQNVPTKLLEKSLTYQNLYIYVHKNLLHLILFKHKSPRTSNHRKKYCSNLKFRRRNRVYLPRKIYNFWRLLHSPVKRISRNDYIQNTELWSSNSTQKGIYKIKKNCSLLKRFCKLRISCIWFAHVRQKNSMDNRQKCK